MRHPRALVAAFVVVSSLVRMYLAHTYYGFQTGDDLEIAEEAFRRAIGLVHSPWDIRSLLIPDLLVAPVVWIAHAAGIRNPLLAELARYPFIALSAVNIVLVYLLGRRWYDEKTAVVAAGLYAFHWMPLVYGSSLFVRTVAITCILGAALLLSEKPSATRAGIAGMLAALAVTARYSEAIFLVALLLAARLNRSRVFAFLGSFALGIVLFVGVYDRLTWERWFGSLIEFAELVFIRRDAASIVVMQPPWWYVSHVLHWIPAALLPLLVVAVRRGEGRRALAFIALPLLILSAIFHKELRYLQLIVPFVMLIAARGFTLWWEQPNRRRLAVALLILAIPLGLSRIGIAARRTTNAVTAALWIAQHRPSAIALSQPWAYGGRLFLGSTMQIADIDIPPNLERIRHTNATFLAVFTSNVDAALRRACAERGLTETKVFAGKGGREVTVFGVR